MTRFHTVRENWNFAGKRQFHLRWMTPKEKSRNYIVLFLFNEFRHEKNKKKNSNSASFDDENECRGKINAFDAENEVTSLYIAIKYGRIIISTLDSELFLHLIRCLFRNMCACEFASTTKMKVLRSEKRT